jgi:transcription termination factor Rho
MGLENLARAHKKDIIFAILKAHAKGGEDIFGDGVLEILTDGFGFPAQCRRLLSRWSG